MGRNHFRHKNLCWWTTRAGLLRALAAAPKGGAALTFYDPQGKRTVAFGFTDDANNAGANLYDGNILAAGSGMFRGGVGIGGPNLAGQPNRGPGIGLAIWQPNGHFALTASTGLDGTGQATQILTPTETCAPTKDSVPRRRRGYSYPTPMETPAPG